MKNRYLLFGFDNYYPSGGFNDFIISSSDIQVVYDYILNHKDNKDTYQIYDLENDIKAEINTWGIPEEKIVKRINSLEFKNMEERI